MLEYFGSTYSTENDTVYNGIGRPGIRVVTFSPVLHNNRIPLAQIIELLLDMGVWGMGTPVEIEFAVNIYEENKKGNRIRIASNAPAGHSQGTGRVSN